jgi:hypothetical protein
VSGLLRRATRYSQETRRFVTTDNIERFPGESRGPSLGGTSSGYMGPGFRVLSRKIGAKGRGCGKLCAGCASG